MLCSALKLKVELYNSNSRRLLLSNGLNNWVGNSIYKTFSIKDIDWRQGMTFQFIWIKPWLLIMRVLTIVFFKQQSKLRTVPLWSERLIDCTVEVVSHHLRQWYLWANVLDGVKEAWFWRFVVLSILMIHLLSMYHEFLLVSETVTLNYSSHMIKATLLMTICWGSFPFHFFAYFVCLRKTRVYCIEFCDLHLTNVYIFVFPEAGLTFGTIHVT